MHVDVNGTRLWFGVDGSALVPDGNGRFDVVDQLARVDCPTLVCVGDLDPIFPIEVAREIVDALPRGVGRLEVLEGAGHFPWLDVPDRHWVVLGAFVAQSPVRTT